MEIINHEEALIILARAVNPTDPASMYEALKIMGAICLVPPNGYVTRQHCTASSCTDPDMFSSL